MSFWNKVTLGTKFLFGGWDAALEYLLNLLNQFLAKESIEPHIAKIHSSMSWALGWLNKLRVFVPAVWLNEYDAIVSVISDIAEAAEDGQLSAAEVKTLTASFAEAKAKWEED